MGTSPRGVRVRVAKALAIPARRGGDALEALLAGETVVHGAILGAPRRRAHPHFDRARQRFSTQSDRKVENQHFGGLALADFDVAGIADLESVARLQVQAGHVQRAARDMYVAQPARRAR